MTTVQIGQRVHSILYGGRDGIIFKIVGEQRPETVKSLGGFGVTGGNAQIYIVFDNGTRSVIPEAILHNVQWHIYDEFATENEIAAALKFAEETEEEGRREAEAEKQRRNKERERISQEYPFLMKVQDSKRLGSHAVGAKNIKKELSLHFPGFTFSVSSKLYSGGCSIGIHWTDGPTEAEVEKIISKYEEGSFNVMEDIYEYNHSNVWPDIYGGAKYVTPNRKYSKTIQDQIADSIGVKLDYDGYGGLNFEDHSERVRFYQVLRDRSFYTVSEKKEASVNKTQPVKPVTEIKKPVGQTATKNQLWALHCITRMDTRGWNISFKDADFLIKAHKSGENIKDRVKDFIAC